MPAVLARVRSLSHRYGATVALDDVTLDIPARCMVGLLGPDGVGKSTLLALIAGIRRIQKGEVFALDGDMRDREHRRASLPRIAYMPQGLGRNLYPTLTVFENLDFSAGCSANPKPSATLASPICSPPPVSIRFPTALPGSCRVV